MAEITLSKHALGRILERANKWTEPALQTAWRAYEQGDDYHEMSGPLQSYVDLKKRNNINGCTYKSFEKRIFVFKKKHLVTVLVTPEHLAKTEVNKPLVINLSGGGIRRLPKPKPKPKTIGEEKVTRTRKSRTLRLKDGQALYDKFFRDPEFEAPIFVEDMRNFLIYTGYSVPIQTIQLWVDQNRVSVTKNDAGTVTSYNGREAFVLCSAYRIKQIAKQMKKPELDQQAVAVNLEPRVKKLFVQMAQKEDTTLTIFLSRQLNQLGQEKINELDQKIAVEMESLRRHYISEVSL